MQKTGRNDPCPCGSGKKYKQCCQGMQAVTPAAALSIPNLLQTALAHHQAGRLPQAEAAYRDILAIDANHADALHYSGLIAFQRGDPQAAIELIGRALARNPDDAYAHCNMGNALLELKRYEEALRSYEQALRLQPDFILALYNRGNALLDLNRNEEALVCNEKVLQIKPDFAQAHINCGKALRDLGRFAEAAASCRRALELMPDSIEAHNNLSVALRSVGQIDDAAASCRRALEIKPDYASAHCNLGSILQDCCQFDAAAASFRRALEIKPDFTEAHSNLLFCLNYHPDLPADAIFAEYRRWNERYARPLFDRRAHGNLHDAGRRLRIAYISPDLRRHSAGYFIGPLLTWHDKTQVEVFAYAEVAREDDYSARFRGEVDHWCNTVGMSDQALAEQIRQDRIDILVDLAGHTAHNRLLVLARKPAPIQVSWMGYGYTTGLDAIDYFLADQEFAPPGCEALFSEKLVRLPVMTAYRPGDGMGEAGPLPALQGTGVRFGTLSRSVRINHHVIRVWAEILKRLPEARLIINSLNYQTAEMQARMLEQFAAHGVAAGQLEIGFESPPWNVLRRIDIGLDCFPHNSGTTLIESLHLGVPYVTLAGRPSVGRLGASFLRGVGHAEWIAHSEQEYVEHAVTLASDLDRLAALRAGLRSQLEASALMDEAGFARAVEAAYRRMWQRWCRGEAPDHVEVK